MKKLLAGFLILFLLSFISTHKMYAQNDEQKTRFVVWEVKVTPSQNDKLIEAVSFQHDFLKEQNYPYAGYVQYTNDGYFWYSTPFQKFAEIDEMNALDEKLWKEHPEKQKEIWEKFKGNFKSIGGLILELQPEISSLIPQSSEPPTGKQFRFFEKIYLKNGMNMEFTEIAKRYKALREKHGIKDPYYFYYPQFASDMSVVYLVDYMGEDAAEHYSLNAEKWEKFGEEGMKLWEDFKPILERIETHIGTVDYDVSYFPN